MQPVTAEEHLKLTWQKSNIDDFLLNPNYDPSHMFGARSSWLRFCTGGAHKCLKLISDGLISTVQTACPNHFTLVLTQQC